MFSFPGPIHRGSLPALNADELPLVSELKTHVETLAGQIGERNYRQKTNLDKAQLYIQQVFLTCGYKPKEQAFIYQGAKYKNVEIELPGLSEPEKILVFGAHYDTVIDSPGANDNGTGVAALLTLCRLFSARRPNCTIRFVAFANEEAPFFSSPGMGSGQYASRCHDRKENIVGMVSLETIGFYSDLAGSQQIPPPLDVYYPDTGNFIGFVSDLPSKDFLAACIINFRNNSQFPAEGLAAPDYVVAAGWSDHFSFWQHGYPALMVTDTAPFRYPYYHTADDTPDKVDYEKTARVVWGLSCMLDALSH